MLCRAPPPFCLPLYRACISCIFDDSADSSAGHGGVSGYGTFVTFVNLHHRYIAVTLPLHLTPPLHHRYITVTSPLHHRYTTGTSPLHHSCITVTSPLLRRYIAVTSPLHRRYITVTSRALQQCPSRASALVMRSLANSCGRRSLDSGTKPAREAVVSQVERRAAPAGLGAAAAASGAWRFWVWRRAASR